MSKHEASMEKIRFYIDKKEAGKRITVDDQVDLVHEITLSVMTGKMMGLGALSTSHWECDFCKKCAKIPDAVCVICYVEGHTYKVNLVNSTLRNKLILDNFEISERAWKSLVIPYTILRYQAHGETETATCCRNFIRISKTHRDIRTALWEKNDAACIPAFEELGKPRNMKLLHSSLLINKVGMPHPRLDPFVDHVFTVCDGYGFEELGVAYNCAKKCFECKKCYQPIKVNGNSTTYRLQREAIEALGLEWRGPDYYIFEELKKGSKRKGE